MVHKFLRTRPLPRLPVCRLDEFGPNPLYSLSYGFRLRNVKMSHTASMRYMWSSAHLHRIVANSVHLDSIRVAFTKEGQRTFRQCLLQWHHFHLCLQVALDLLVDYIFHPLHLLGCELLRMGEIEA